MVRFIRPRAPADERETASGSGWRRFRRIVEAVLFVIGVPTAVVAFLALGPQAWQATHQRQVAYNDLKWLHAGYSQQFLQTRFGVPTLVRSVSTDPALTQIVFVEREFAVSALMDDADSAVVIGVFACNPAFAPSLMTPVGTAVRLNASPLARAETDPRPDGVPVDRLNARALHYQASGPSGPSGMLVETGTLTFDAESTLGESYLLGVNGACGADVDFFGGSRAHLGERDGIGTATRPFVESYRDRVAPNFYVESTDPRLSVGEGGCLRLSDFPHLRGCVTPTPSAAELPINLKSKPQPEWWQNLPF